MSSEQSGRPLFDAAGMRSTDRWAIEERRVPSLELMEAAGSALAREAERLAAASGGGGPIRIVCGKGNNGGDGFVAARLLRSAGHRVDVLLLWPGNECEGDAAVNLGRLDGDWVEAGGDVGSMLAGSAVIVDAIFGTGFSGEARDPAASAIGAIADAHGAGVAVLACDLPSGVDASSGEVAGLAVRASSTVTFHAAKLGMFVAPGKQRCGEVVVAEIGVPQGSEIRPAAWTIGVDALAKPPGRGAESTKFTSGEVLVVGGSRGMTGAACMAAMAAARGGAGYVTVGVPSSLEPIFEVKLTEEMTLGLAEVDGSLTAEAAGPLLERAERAAAVLIGPGIGRQEGTAELVRDLAPSIAAPLVIDADALNALGTDLELLAARTAPTILTPHAGELARLLGGDAAEVSARRVHRARAAADRAGAIVVLKGDDTIVTDGRSIVVNELASPALATAGTGDVLGGLTAALLARGTTPFAAASAAVYAHARSGRFAAAGVGVDSVVATDVIEALPLGLDPGARGIE